MTLVAYPYTTQAEMERKFSEAGVLSFSDHDENGTEDTDVVADAINEATAEIDLYCSQRYAQADLQGSTIINRWATIFAIVFLCENRGNPPPERLLDRMEFIYERLEKIREGAMNIPGLAFIGGQRPTFSNLTVDRRFRRSKVRRTATNSSGQSSALPRDDAPDLATFD